MLQQHPALMVRLQPPQQVVQQQEQPRRQLQLEALPHLLEQKQRRELFRQAQDHQQRAQVLDVAR